MAKKIAGYVKLQVPSGQANPSPPIGPALGQAGVNIMEFCKAFNADTQEMEQGIPVPVLITVFEDKTFSFTKKTPPASYYLKKAAKLNKAAANPGKETVGKVSLSQVQEIVDLKMVDLNAFDRDQATKMIIGSAKSMGILVEGIDG